MMQADDDNNPFYTGEEKLLPPANPAPLPRISGQYGTSQVVPEPAPADLQFQSFAHTSVNIPSDSRSSIRPGSSSPFNPVAGKSGPPTDAPNEFSEDPGSPMPPSSQPPAGAHFWTISYYQHLFDVDTAQVLHRIGRSMLPFKFSFIEYASRNPDLYGPFWIATTLIFAMTISGNLAEFFANGQAGAYEFNKVPIAASVIYGYSIVIPLVMWAVFKWMKIPFKLTELLCIYGYALFVFVPACVLCIIPLKYLQWVFTAVAAALSGWFLVTNLIPPLKQQEARVGYITLAVVGVLHLGLALAFKLYFFHSTA